MTIQLIVEGEGEEAAARVLLERLVSAAEAWTVRIARPHRRRRTDIGRKETLQKAVSIARRTPDCAAILILFDADDDCPKERVAVLEQWACQAAEGIPCAVVMANREYEAWFLASMESLRGTAGIREDASSHPNPEAPRNAKGEVQRRMRGRYSPRSDQASLTARFDLAAAYRGCRSFRRLVSAFGGLLETSQALPSHWPPAAWIE